VQSVPFAATPLQAPLVVVFHVYCNTKEKLLPSVHVDPQATMPDVDVEALQFWPPIARIAAVANVPGVPVAITSKECTVGTGPVMLSVVAIEERRGMNPPVQLCPEMFAVGQMPSFTVHVGDPDPV
jgi:hypothetical protein